MERATINTCCAWNTVKYILIYTVLLALVRHGQANSQGEQKSAVSCSSHQKQSCQKAAQNDNLEKLGAGGVCATQKYVHYTHTCTLNRYFPDVDYCCCALNITVMCCRYNQMHDLYRCQIEQDFIGTIEEVADEKKKDKNLGLLLPAIFVPLGIAVVLVIMVFFLRRIKKKDEAQMKRKIEVNANEQYEMQPLANAAPTRTQQNQSTQAKRPVEDILEGERLVPSAPGAEDSHHQHGAKGGGSDVNGAAAECPSCSAQPPTYNESLQHQVV